MIVCNCPPPPFACRLEPGRPIPDDAACEALLLRFGMPEHIRQHSRNVAMVATAVANAARKSGAPTADDTMVAAIRASALLHDIAKAYTIAHGGNHGQIGAAWVAELTRHPAIAQGVLHHVAWPGELDPAKFLLPLVVQYADKRVMHEHQVTVVERFEDLLTRYGHTKDIRAKIRENMEHTLKLERKLSALIGVDLRASSARGGRLVAGT